VNELSVDPNEAHDAVSMIAAAGLDWSVEQHPLEAVVEREYQSLRVPVPRRENAERFIEAVMRDDPELARNLRIEERELSAGGPN
jgi:hypothetical protein